VLGLNIRASWEAFQALLERHVSPQKVTDEMREVIGKALRSLGGRLKPDRSQMVR